MKQSFNISDENFIGSVCWTKIGGNCGPMMILLFKTAAQSANDDNTPMHKRETGGRISGPAFSMYYKNILKLYPQIQRKFEVPDGIIEVDMNKQT